MQISKHIHALKIPFNIQIASDVILERFVYAFLIYGSNICLIDTGVASSANLILDYIIKTGRNPKEISLIVQTHSHPDHIGATKAIKELTGCSVAVHKNEKAWIDNVDLQFKERPIPGFYNLVGGSVPVDKTLEDGEVIDLGNGLTLEVFHTPGHSKGSVSLLFKEDNALFTGDAIILPGDIPIYEDYEEIIKSLKKLKEINNIHFLLSSWDDSREGKKAYEAIEMSLNYLQHIHEIIAKTNNPSLDSMELCKLVVSELGLPPMSATPMLAKSFSANIKALRKKV